MTTNADGDAPPGATGAGTQPRVDPRAPRFGQAITALGLLGGLALREPILVYAVAAILVIAVVSRWRIDPYGLLWRHAVRRVVSRPAERDPAPPHRFAQVLGAIGTAIASGLLLANGNVAPEVAILGYAIAGVVALLAGLAATTGICVGCRMYRQVALFRRLNLV